MDTNAMTAWYGSLALVGAQILATVSLFLPRILGALLVLIIGAAIARFFKRIVVKTLEAARLSSMLRNTPIEHFLMNADLGHKLEEIIGTVLYWLAMLLVIHTSVSILGLEPISTMLAKVLGYLPSIFSAVLVLFFGTLLAGVVESLVKGAIKSIDGHSSRVLGKVSSYLVITIAVLAAVSELGIASEFIMVLFIGFVAMVSLGVGLAIGLGGQDVVRKMMNSWYERTKEEVQE